MKSKRPIETLIRVVRRERVILAPDLAAVYGVETRALNQAVKRNAARFPGDFVFPLSKTEVDSLRSQNVILSGGHGKHSKYLPHAFTEHGAIMAAMVLNSPQAVAMSVYVVRAFALGAREDWTVAALVAWLDRQIEHRDILPAESAEFLRRAVRGLPEVRFWIRNLARKPTSFRLQTASDWFYPDFVCQLADGRALVVEYKGEHLLADAEGKRTVGEVWAGRSGGRCLFVMPSRGNFSSLESVVRSR